MNSLLLLSSNLFSSIETATIRKTLDNDCSKSASYIPVTERFLIFSLSSMVKGEGDLVFSCYKVYCLFGLAKRASYPVGLCYSGYYVGNVNIYYYYYYMLLLFS